MAFGKWLRERRIAARLRSQPQAELKATRAGLATVTQGKLSYIERGWNENPEPALFRALAALYEVPYEAIVREWTKTRYDVDVEAEAPPAKDAYLLTPEEADCIERWRELSARDREWLLETLDRSLGKRPPHRPDGFLRWPAVDRRSGKDRRAG